jgi:predicted DsbA family dithiol-disulfide isomerase
LGPCLETGKHRQKVERETEAAANLGGRGTPLFIVNQRPLVGAQPYSVFQKIIDEELKSQEAKKKTQ